MSIVDSILVSLIMTSMKKDLLEELGGNIIMFILRTYYYIIRNMLYIVKNLNMKVIEIIKNFSDTHKKAIERMNCQFNLFNCSSKYS